MKLLNPLRSDLKRKWDEYNETRSQKKKLKLRRELKALQKIYEQQKETELKVNGRERTSA